MSTSTESVPDLKRTKKSYAILGATGATGSQIVDCLLDREDIHIHLYARNAQKLNAQNPKLASHPSVTTHIGDLSDTSLLASCLRECSVVFSTVATNVNIPDTTVAQRTAYSVASALQLLRDECEKSSDETKRDWKCPLVVVLSAAPLNANFKHEVPKPMKWLMFTALKFLYSDVKAAVTYFRNEQPWIPMVQATPGGLFEGVPGTGRITIVEDDTVPAMSYGDLARGMIQIAEEGSIWVGKDVGFMIEGSGFQIAMLTGLLSNMVFYILPGLCYTAFPWVYHLTHRS